MGKRCFFFIFCTLFVSPLLYAQNSSPADVQLAWNFDNGSLGGWTQNELGEIVLSHAPQSGEVWYYFRIDGVERKTLTFVFENARKDFYNGNSFPAISYDQTNWSYIKSRTIQPHPSDLNRVRYTFTHTFAANRVWLAFSPPYSNKNLDDTLESISAHPHVVVETICQSPIRRLPLPLITITDPEMPNNDKQCALFLAREEAMESASSRICEGLIRFLLSDDPVAAAVKRRCIILLIPILDRDGVALGSAVHPLSENGANVYWTETWPETSYSFFEQRQMKRFLQGWKDTGKNVHYSLRIHSSAWNQDQFRREHCAENLLQAQERLYGELLTTKYLPWYRNVERVLQDTRFSRFIADIFPNAITGLCQSEYRYDRAFGLPYSLPKTADDLNAEGELIAYALAEVLGVPASDPHPFLHAAEIYETTGRENQLFHVRCVYRDILNRPPQYVRIQEGDRTTDLKPVRTEGVELNYQTGVLYTGEIASKETIGSHSFQTSNGSRTASIPNRGQRIGPLLHTLTSIERKNN